MPKHIVAVSAERSPNTLPTGLRRFWAAGVIVVYRHSLPRPANFATPINHIPIGQGGEIEFSPICVMPLAHYTRGDLEVPAISNPANILVRGVHDVIPTEAVYLRLTLASRVKAQNFGNSSP